MDKKSKSKEDLITFILPDKHKKRLPRRTASDHLTAIY